MEKKKKGAPAAVAQLVRALPHRHKAAGWLGSGSGHTPGLQTRPLVPVRARGNQLTLLLAPLFSLKVVKKMSSGEDKKFKNYKKM